MSLKLFAHVVVRGHKGVSRSWVVQSAVVGVLCFIACSKAGKNTNETYHYKAPRNMGFSLDDWLKEHPDYASGQSYGEAPPQKCTAYDLEKCPKYCDERGYYHKFAPGGGHLWLRTDCPDPEHLRIIEERTAGLPPRPWSFPRFWGVLDIDYDFRDVVYVNNYPYTPVRVLMVLEVFEDLRPPLAPVEETLPIRVERCIGDGVCKYGPEGYGFLWSVVNLVLGEYLGGCCERDIEPFLFIWEAFPIENGRIYDWWGGSTDWEDYRKKIIAFVEAQKELDPEEYAGYAKYCERMSYCQSSDSTEKPSTDSGSLPDGVFVFDL